jgi:hypothetical protein
MKHIVASATIAAFLVLPSTGLVFAAGNPVRTGQPVFECPEDGSMGPGNAENTPGAPFNEEGGQAGTVYAGTPPHNSGNGQTNDNGQASIYDVACSKNQSPPSPPQ